MSDEHESQRLAIQVENLRTRVMQLEARMREREVWAGSTQASLTAILVKIENLSTRVGLMAAGIGTASGLVTSLMSSYFLR